MYAVRYLLVLFSVGIRDTPVAVHDRALYKYRLMSTFTLHVTARSGMTSVQ